MLLNYESELCFWEPKEHEGMYTKYPDSTDEMIDLYNERLERIGKLHMEEPSRKHSAESKIEYENWVRFTHDNRDELNKLADAIHAKRRELLTKRYEMGEMIRYAHKKVLIYI